MFYKTVSPVYLVKKNTSSLVAVSGLVLHGNNGGNCLNAHDHCLGAL